MADDEQPKPGGWNRIHFVLDDLPDEVPRLLAAGMQFRNDIVTGPGGSQVLLIDPSGNLVDVSVGEAIVICAHSAARRPMNFSAVFLAHSGRGPFS
jgi:hypothetical protein